MADWTSDSLVSMASGGSTRDVHFVSWQISHDVNKMVSTWRIEFAENIEASESAKFTIKRGIGSVSAGGIGSPLYASSSYGAELLSDVSPNSWDFVVGSDSLAWACEGTLDSNQKPTVTSDKDLYFVNSTWLSTLAGGKLFWRFEDGDLYWMASGQRSVFKDWRIEHPDLPAKGTDKDTYRIFINYADHWNIAAYLASLINCRIVITTPFVPLRSVLKFSANTSYMEMLNSLFSMWNATIKIETVDDISTIYVLDTAGPDLTVEQPTILNVQASAIERISIKNLGKDKEPNDHVIVKGAKDIGDTRIPEAGDLKQIRMIPIEPDESQLVTFSWQESFDFANSYKTMGDYEGGFNEADAPPQRRPKYVYRTETWFLDPLNSANMYIVWERDESFDNEGIIHAHQVQYTYGPGYKLIYTSEREWGLVQKPGQPYKEFMLIRHTAIDQSWITDGVDRASTIEIVEEPVVITEFTDPNTGKVIKAGPVPISRAQEQNRIAKNPASKQKLIDMTTKTRVSKVNRAARGVLAQNTKEFDTIAQIFKINNQIIRDPRNGKDGDRSQFKYEAFLPGQTVYHKAVTVEHPDICTNYIADAIAQRILAASSANQTRFEISLQLVLPLQIPEGDLIMKLPSITTESSVSGSWVAREHLPAGKYIVAQVDESMSAGMDGRTDHQQTFSLRSVL